MTRQITTSADALTSEAGRYATAIERGMQHAGRATVRLACLALKEYATRKGALALASVEARLPGAIVQRLARFLATASGGGIEFSRGHFRAIALRGVNFRTAQATCNASLATLDGAQALPAPTAPTAPTAPAPAPVEFDAQAAFARLYKRAEKHGALASLRAACITFIGAPADAPADAPAAPAVKTRRRK